MVVALTQYFNGSQCAEYRRAREMLFLGELTGVSLIFLEQKPANTPAAR